MMYGPDRMPGACTTIRNMTFRVPPQEAATGQTDTCRTAGNRR